MRCPRVTDDAIAMWRQFSSLPSPNLTANSSWSAFHRGQLFPFCRGFFAKGGGFNAFSVWSSLIIVLTHLFALSLSFYSFFFLTGAIFEQGTDEIQSAFKFAMLNHNLNVTARRFELQAYVDVINTADAFKLSKLSEYCGCSTFHECFVFSCFTFQLLRIH